jgi:hypothetical protein
MAQLLVFVTDASMVPVHSPPHRMWYPASSDTYEDPPFPADTSPALFHAYRTLIEDP